MILSARFWSEVQRSGDCCCASEDVHAPFCPLWPGQLTATKYAAHVPVAVCPGCDQLAPECTCPPRVSQPPLSVRLRTRWLAIRWHAARALTRALGIEPASLADEENE